MGNSKIIILEGAQGSGKTTVTDFLRHSVATTNLYRLSGTSDKSSDGLIKAKKMYESLLDYIQKLENMNINLLFDRTFFSEENYCRLGYKEYSFNEEYYKLVSRLDSFDFDIYYITLYLEDTNLFRSRLNRDGKAAPEYAQYKDNKSIAQQEVYLEMADELKNISSNIKVYKLKNDRPFEETEKELRSIINF